MIDEKAIFEEGMASDSGAGNMAEGSTARMGCVGQETEAACVVDTDGTPDAFLIGAA